MALPQKITPALFLVAGLVAVFVLWQLASSNKAENDRGEFGGRKSVATTAVSSAEPAMEVRQLSGTIKSISGETVTLAVRYPRDPSGDTSLDERLVTIDSNTRIIVMVQKDQKAFEKELAEYQNKMSAIRPGSIPNPRGMPAPPQIYVKKDGDISSLKIGGMIDITTAENVKGQKSFVALTIEMTGIAAFPVSTN